MKISMTLLKELGESPMSGDSDDTPTGGGGMDISNYLIMMEGGNLEDNSPQQTQFNLLINKKIYLKRKSRNKRNSMDGDIQKTSITKTDSKNLNAIEESGSELKEVGKGVNDGYYYGNQTSSMYRS